MAEACLTLYTATALNLGEYIAASPVVALTGLVLASSAPSGPAPHAPRVRRAGVDQANQQAADLGQRVPDHARVAGADPLFRPGPAAQNGRTGPRSARAAGP